jgi:hypothetical protein
MVRRYTELIQMSQFEDRFDYLVLRGSVGLSTFGHDRWLNQRFYMSAQWRALRTHVIARDLGCDLGVVGYEIYERAYIHHMNPVTVEDLVHGRDEVLDPEFLITTTHDTHNAIHYGDRNLLPKPYVPRRPNDTKLW